MAPDDNDDLVGVLQTASRRSVSRETAPTLPAPALPTPATSTLGESTPTALANVPPAEVTDYEALLLHVNRHKKGKGIQLDPQSHRTLCYIARVMGNIALSDLLHNIVRLHFQQYSTQIQDMLKKKEQLNKKSPLLFQQS